MYGRRWMLALGVAALWPLFAIAEEQSNAPAVEDSAVPSADEQAHAPAVDASALSSELVGPPDPASWRPLDFVGPLEPEPEIEEQAPPDEAVGLPIEDPALEPVAPIINPPPKHEEPPVDRRRTVLVTLVGLLCVTVLAYLGGHRSVRKLEQQMGLSQMITAGFPFVIMGIIARLPAVGIVSDQVLAQLGPALRFALAWIGFSVGFRFDARLIGDVPPKAARTVLAVTAVPFACVVAACGALLFGIENLGRQLVQNPAFLRDAILLGTAAAMTAPDGPDAEPMRRKLVRLEELAGIVGLLVVAAYFRPSVEAQWLLPGTGWVFLTLGLGFVLGSLVYALLQRTTGSTDLAILTLGGIAFAGGAAAYLALSPVVVAFVAGVMVANLPGEMRTLLEPTLRRFERPIYLLFLFVAGAIWSVGDWRSWALALVFATLRLVGKWLGARMSWRDGTIENRRALALAPMGPLAIAIVVSGQLLYSGQTIALVSSAVIGGALLTEVLLQLGRRAIERLESV